MTKPEPPLREHYPATVQISTRWNDNDVYGHVHNIIYYSWFDTAVNQYLIQSGALDIHGGEVIGLVVESGCSYFDSVTFPDLIVAGLKVDRIGNSSVHYSIGLFKNDEQTACASGHFVHVYVNRASRRPVSIPNQFLQVLRTLESK